ncbi:MAG: hypothetical protein JWQ32_582 [Marmoricola sp.]|nr:hypothetical protein [Marmoricola sp.]
MTAHAFDANWIADMALRLHREPSTAETVERVLQYARQAVDCDYAGVIVVHKKSRIESIAATDPLVEKIAQIQVEVSEGPDLDVLEDRISVIVDDISTEARWPRWAHLAAATGIRSLLNVRLSTGEEVLGTLNLYSRQPYKFDVDDQAVAHVLARHAAVALAASRQQENLMLAADARKMIGQAQGILMERFDLDADQAFAVLTRYSQNNNVKLRDVASQLIATRALPAVTTGGDFASGREPRHAVPIGSLRPLETQ